MAGRLRFKSREDGSLLAVIGDEDTVTGLLLAGVGNVSPNKQTNFFIVDSKTTKPDIEKKFHEFVKREEIVIVLINQHIANDIRYLLDTYDNVVPTILEIPSKDHPYDPSKDSVMLRVRRMLGISEDSE